MPSGATPGIVGAAAPARMKSMSKSETSTGGGGCSEAGRGWGMGSLAKFFDCSRWFARCRARVDGNSRGPGSDSGSNGGSGRDRGDVLRACACGPMFPDGFGGVMASYREIRKSVSAQAQCLPVRLTSFELVISSKLSLCSAASPESRFVFVFFGISIGLLPRRPS